MSDLSITIGSITSPSGIVISQIEIQLTGLEELEDQKGIISELVPSAKNDSKDQKSTD